MKFLLYLAHRCLIFKFYYVRKLLLYLLYLLTIPIIKNFIYLILTYILTFVLLLFNFFFQCDKIGHI